MRTEVEISDSIVGFFRQITSASLAHGSYKSWEHCISYFRQNSEIDLDTASLNVAFYLASWGMYRGGAPITKYDYLIHKPAISVLLEPDFKCLHGIDEIAPSHIRSILLAYDRLCQHYAEFNVKTPETLVTKILLGTLGCVPAYDRFLRESLTKLGIPARFGEASLKGIADFCLTHVGLKRARAQLGLERTYPIMRIFDMYCHSISSR